ncbi:MAG: ATP-binding cassette domain-containing protein [Chitinivibrionales bacterium]|nr:ATP-binding cassette domain-containing protein [Chitinivibrionales bacterium]
MEAIGGMTPPDSGEIFVDGIRHESNAAKGPQISIVYQDQALFPHMTVWQNIEYGLHGRVKAKPERSARVRALARELQIEQLLGRKPGTLSGGESQRVALARALAVRPKILMLDEPLSSLDIRARAGIRSILRELNRSGITMIHVTHDYEEAISLASRIAVMERGTIVQSGNPREIFMCPKSEFVARFTGIKNFYEGSLVRTKHGAATTGTFLTGPLTMSVAVDARPGNGFIAIRSEDVTLSLAKPESSARNIFEGTIVDIIPTGNGVEIAIDTGIDIVARVTGQSCSEMNLECGKKVWVQFKATAARFIPAASPP